MLILARSALLSVLSNRPESLFPQPQDPVMAGGANRRAGWYRAASVPEERQGSPAIDQGEDARDIQSGLDRARYRCSLSAIDI